eukprot:s12419_g1.t1
MTLLPAEPAGHGGRSVSAAKASSHLRSLLLRFKRPRDEDEHCAASTCAGGNGEDYAYHGGAFFADDSCDFDFGGDGQAALAAALLSETRDPDQVSIFTGVADGAADGRPACSAERTTWFEDDCCDFDLEVTLEAAAASRTMTGRSLLPSKTGCILRCLLLQVVRADREVHAYPR